MIETPLGTTLWDVSNAIHEPADCDAGGLAVAEVMLRKVESTSPKRSEGVCGLERSRGTGAPQAAQS